MRLRRTLPALALAISLGVLASCGGDDTSESGDAAPDASATSDAAEPEEEPAVEEASGPLDVCSLLTVDEVGAILGGAVTLSEVPGGGCSFDQEDPRAPSVGVAETPYDEGSGGMEGTRTGVSGVLDGAEPETVSNIGDDAFVAVGTAMGGENQQGGGAVLLDGSTVQLTVLQGSGLPRDEVRRMTIDLLTLVAAKV